MLVKDLSLFGQGVYLQVPRRQFICPHCGKYPTEPLNFIDKRRNYTKRYERRNQGLKRAIKFISLPKYRL
ncbi:transposase family protein [Gloeothece citriformis]|uniref:transposase family protein n=1 Tax=Gloeothece citriformis TaxID=2546356 RepID=UPI003B835709